LLFFSEFKKGGFETKSVVGERRDEGTMVLARFFRRVLFSVCIFSVFAVHEDLVHRERFCRHRERFSGIR
jgi:hypothetical protein